MLPLQKWNGFYNLSNRANSLRCPAVAGRGDRGRSIRSSNDRTYGNRRETPGPRFSSNGPDEDDDRELNRRGGGRGSQGGSRGGRNPSGRGRGRGQGRWSPSAGPTTQGRGRFSQPYRGRRASDETLARRAPRDDSDSEDDLDDSDDDSDGGIDEGFTVIGRADTTPRTRTDTAAPAPGQAGPRGPGPGRAASLASASPAGAVDPLDGSRFWIETSGIDDLDEDEDEDEGGEDEEGDEDEDIPQSAEELLENMRSLGFTLQGLDAPAPSTAASGANAGDAARSEGPTALPPAEPAAAAAARATGTDLALRDLRDAFIATMKPPGLPPWFLGPVEATVGGASGVGKNRAGAAAGPTGRGTSVRTTRAVAQGELLAVSLPLAVLYCRRGTTPENEDLADLMMGVEARGGAEGALLTGVANRFAGMSDLQQSLLAMLWRGHPPGPNGGAAGAEPSSPVTDASGAGGKADTGAGAAATAAKRRPTAGTGAASEGASASTGGPVKRAFLELVAKSAADRGAPRSAPVMEASELYRLVNANCLGEDFQDLALSQLRGERPLGHIALWPEAAFTGHSCAPNATAYALGDRLILRAVVDEKAGAEVTLNWLGSLLTAPLEVRREELRQQYGFTCGCNRCNAEARYADTPLASLVSSTYAKCQQMSPRLEAAIEAGDVDAVAAVRERLLGMQAEVEAGIRGATPKINSRVRRWLQASVYDMYDMISLCADELAAAAALGRLPASGTRSGPRGGKPPAPPTAVVETESLLQCCRIVEEVTPGSDGHVYLAAEALMRCLERYGPEHEEYRQVRAALARAYRARYGNVGAEVMEQLVAARLAAEAAEDDDEDEDGGEDEV